MSEQKYARINFWLTGVFFILFLFNVRTLYIYGTDDIDDPDWLIWIVVFSAGYMLFMMRRCWREYRKYQLLANFIANKEQWTEDML